MSLARERGCARARLSLASAAAHAHASRADTRRGTQLIRSSALAALPICLLVADAIGGIAGLLVSVSVFVPVFILVLLFFGVSAFA